MGKPPKYVEVPGEKLGIDIKIEHAPGIKCPRCWHWHEVRGNPQDLCDRCIKNILEGLDDWVAIGQLTQQEADDFRAEVRAMVNRWKA